MVVAKKKYGIAASSCLAWVPINNNCGALECQDGGRCEKEEKVRSSFQKKKMTQYSTREWNTSQSRFDRDSIRLARLTHDSFFSKQRER